MKKIHVKHIAFFLYISFAQIASGQTIYLQVLDGISPVEDSYITITSGGEKKEGISDANGQYKFSLSTDQTISLSIYHMSFEKFDTTVYLAGDMNLAINLTQLNYQLNAVTFASTRINNAKSVTLNQSDFLKLASSFDDPSRLVLKAPGFSGTNDQSNALSFRNMPSHYYKWQINGLDVVNPNHLANAGTLNDLSSINAGGVNMVSGQLIQQYKYALPGSIGVGNNNQLSGSSDMKLVDSLGSFAQMSLLGLEAGTGINIGGVNIITNYRYSFTGLLADFGASFGGESIKFQDFVLGINKTSANSSYNGFLLLGNNSNIFTSPDSIKSFKETQDIDFHGSAMAAGFNFNSNVGTKKNHISAGLAYSVKTSDRESETKVFFNDRSTYSNEQKMLSGRLAYHFSTNIDVGLNYSTADNNLTFNRSGEFVESQISKKYTVSPFRLFYTQRFDLGKGFDASVQLPLDMFAFTKEEIYFDPIAELSKQFGSALRITGRAYKNVLALQPPFDYGQAKSLNYELGLDHIFRTGQIGLVLFHHKIYDTKGSLDEVWNYNAKPNDRGLSKGLSLYASKNSEKGIWWDINASMMNIRNDTNLPNNTDVGFVTNAQIGKMVRMKKNRLSFALALIYRDGQKSYKVTEDLIPDYTSGTIQSKAYFRLDVRANYFRKNSVLSLDIQNVSSHVNEGAYNYDPFTKQYYFVSQLGLIPVLSYRYYFKRNPMHI